MLTPRRAGERRHLVSLQAITGRTASGDGYTTTWETYANVRAAVVPATASATERATAQTQQVPITHVVTIDYRSDLRAAHRVLFDDRPLYIRGLQNEDERNRTHVLSCEERAT